MDRLFTRIANWAAALAVHRLAFFTALTVINTATTIITFLIVFLIQNTQNGGALAMHLKLNEIIKALKEADNRVMLVEDETIANFVKLKEQYTVLSAKHRDLAEDHLELSEKHEELAEAHQGISGKQRRAAR